MAGVAKTKKAPEVFISEADEYLFAQGTHYDIYKKLGAHPSVENGKKGMFFAVWAPHALQVHVFGTFNGWEETQYPMKKKGPGGIYELFIPGVGTGEMYKFLITAPDGRKLYKADPFANYAEKRPGTASITTDISHFKWTDSVWMEERAGKDMNREPLAVYECHIGSWMKHPDGTEDGFYNYREFADRLVSYLKEVKFTHVELMGVAEHPFDGSWGYQVTGYYAPTSRYGTPEDFAYLINTLHRNKIGVILDWVPAHFPKDAHGLAEFDGEPLFEHPDPRLGEHPDWGTKIFNYGKNEVKNFLIANALYWVEQFHIDGLRVDAVASMLYLDYGKNEGEWIPNKYGENKNLEAIEFFRHINTLILGRNPGTVMIAEESTAWPQVTGEAQYGGLNFTYKWNMGWMHDFLDYMKLDPYFRKDNHHKMTFAMSYNGSEHYILVLSHDEVVHLKCSMINKMPGEEADKFANLKAGYAFMMGHPGKKLLFMGQDIGQYREWSEERELDWYVLENPHNKGLQEFVKELLHIYRKYPCMYELDGGGEGFEWINADDAEKSIYTFLRKGKDAKKRLLFVFNFTPVARDDFRVGVPELKDYKLILTSEEERFAGSGNVPAKKTYKAEKRPWDNREYSIRYPLPPYGVAVFEY